MSKHIMMGAWVWFAANILGAIMSGTYIGSTQQNVFNLLSVFTVRHVGPFPVLIPNWYFFDGILAIMTSSNYIFLQGNPLIIIVYLLNIGLTIGMVVLFSSVVTSVFRRA